MSAALIIAAASIKEHSRRKLIAFFVITSVAMTLVLGYLVLRRSDTGGFFGEGSTLITAVALGVFEVFMLLATLAVSMGNIGAPFKSGEAQLVLARPISRSQYALGRLMASWASVIGLAILFLIETEAVRLVAGYGLSLDLLGHWGITAFNFLLVAVITTIFSVFFSTPVIAAIFGYIAQTIANSIGLLEGLVRVGIIKGFAGKGIRLVWYAFPKFLVSPLRARVPSGPGAESARGVIGAMEALKNTPVMVTWAVAYMLGLVLLLLFLVTRREI